VSVKEATACRATGRGQPCSASDIVETGTRLVRPNRWDVWFVPAHCSSRSS